MSPMLRQCAITAIITVHAASTMFAMAAMLGRLAAQLKMPRLDAYIEGVSLWVERPYQATDLVFSHANAQTRLHVSAGDGGGRLCGFLASSA
jgi:hypothetical protein